MRKDAEYPLVGLDLNATRALAMGGVADGPKQLLPLDGTEHELPLAISLEGRRPEVGRAGALLLRRSPHLVCHNFLSALGSAREWVAPRHRLTASDALTLVWERLRAVHSRAKGISLCLPAYLNAEQIDLAAVLASRARVPVLGAVPTPLAAASAAYSEQPWAGPAIVVDVDDHALTLTLVQAEHDRLQLVQGRVLTRLGVRAWKDRLLIAVADRCIRQSRRDPRDSGPVEQALHDQLQHILAHWQPGRMVELIVHSGAWYQNVMVRSEEFQQWCAPLVEGARQALEQACESLPAGKVNLVVTAAAGQLPGLCSMLEALLGSSSGVAEAESNADFGEALLEEPSRRQAMVQVLLPDASARAAHGLAAAWQRADLPRGLLSALPFPAPLPLDSGPARLHYRGQDHLLREAPFLLGTHGGCDLVFDEAVSPTVSARHCEIVFERWTYVLRDRSRHGTLVNQRPVVQEMVLHAGDWIRLGAGGPQLRFLGRASASIHKMSRA